MRIRNKEEYEDYISKDIAWRKKELTKLKFLVGKPRDVDLETATRAGIVLLYSHWEGFIKYSSHAFFDYLNYKEISYVKLKNHLKVCAIIEHNNNNWPKRCFEELNDICNNRINYNNKFQIDPKKYIETDSNLKSSVLKKIMAQVGIDYSEFQLFENLIDQQLLGKRNEVAHGNRVSISKDEFNHIYTEITQLLRLYQTLITNVVAQDEYLVGT